MGNGEVKPIFFAECPACKNKIWIKSDEVRRSTERLEGKILYSDAVYVSTFLKCPVCELTLTGSDEIRAANLPQQHIVQFEEDLAHRFMYGDDEDAYGDE
ncbi:hypothetical protein [Microbispora siamensis]|uniref:Uncharacterized protein n=1 Tax=Microbispora siamensis TaxID=564413 RepID=A0ABQ4GM81_9ACTN|nr:hypothetical protein [Microbispora siamensis]GIH62542.1 hypothetical protein Msi02_33590 [Microbispora siamensis]